MSDRKLAKAVQILFRQIGRLYRSLSKGVITWLLRTMLVVQRRQRPIAGFVLPTTVLLILVVALTAGAITYRAFSSSTRAISETQNRVIYNAATPAIDRARAKLEFLFDDKKDTRYPGGVPSENVLAAMMLNKGTGTQVRGRAVATLQVGGRDAYTLAGETRIDINGDGQTDNAWIYQDPNTNSTVIYSINFMTPPDDTTSPGWQKLIQAADDQKAAGPTYTGDSQRFPLVRTGPLSNTSAVTCGRSSSGQTNVEGGWYVDKLNSAILRKRFQVDALVIPNSAGSPGAANNFATLEFSQDRQLDRGNKWGAWFRNDLEIFPGPAFQWNGAMHTEGSLIVGNDAFSAYLISAPASCLYIESASEISVTENPANNNGQSFVGVIASGKVNNDTYGGNTLIYPHRANPIGAGINMTSSNDWARASSPLGISLDPVAIVTRDGYVARNTTDPTNVANLQKNTTFTGRFLAKSETAPYVDDTYRADDRYGPKPKYKNATPDDNGDGTPDGEIPSTNKVGDLIPSSNTLLVANTAAGADASQLGLDGYWERRARNEGLRILVGQRLELGNSYGWVTPQDRDGGKPLPLSSTSGNPANPAFVQAYTQTTAPSVTDDYTQTRDRNFQSTATASAIDVDTSDNEGDPLYPSYGTSVVTHEARQRRALRDNPAAVQSTAVYHAAVNPDYPIACIATTTHPGSPITLRQSINFVPTRFIDSTPATAGGGGINSSASTGLLVDFFNGRGTNGWEFDTPGLTQAGFEAAMSSSTSSLRVALQNLANFAGDHISDARTGAFPPTQETGQIHPDPELTMWGNFSNLRRTLTRLNAVGYTNLSIADKSYLQTAGCTLGMLAYNVEQADKFDPRNWRNDSSSAMQTLALDLIRLMNGDVGDGEVLTKDRLSTYGYDATDTTPDPAQFNPRDYDRVPAEAFLGALREQIIAANGSPNDPRIRLAELIYTHFQIRRDRTYGFRQSPAANTWNYNPYVTDRPGNFETNLWSSACDPNIFALNTSTTARQAGPGSARESTPGGDPTLNVMRLALSRLCGTVIPPGATREYPGDLNLPARSNNVTAIGTNTDPTGVGNNSDLTKQYVPRNTVTNTYENPDSYSTKAPSNLLSIFRQTSVTAAPYNDRPYVQATVAPKWPSLYYLFPNFPHDHDGAVERVSGVCVDHRQPKGNLQAVNFTGCTETGTNLIAAFQPWAEPYITDNYVTTANGSVSYQPVNPVAPVIADALLPPQTSAGATPGYPVAINYAAVTTGNNIRFSYQPFDTAPVPESSLSGVALQPRKLPGGFSNPLFLDTNSTWQLPVSPLSSYTVVAQNTPPNRIMAPNGANVTGTVAVIPFLDRVMFNGREWLPARVLDIDLGMLRRTRPANQTTRPVGVTYDDVWLPVSGIVYAFREDAVREDAISRPASGTVTNARTPGSETDPAITSTGVRGISIKSVDFIPDPDRRPHGFRLRNGTQLKRHSSMSIPDTDNVRGLSLFTDNPVYIMGNYNLHQDQGDDVVGTRLEEFLETLPDTTAYTEAQFYNRSTIDNRFASPTTDRWRPSEILADAISILSDTFCDGSVMDGFMTAGTGSTATITTTSDPNQISPAVRGVYQASTGDTGGADVYDNQSNAALFGPGCTTNGITSFLNQNRPSTNPRPGGADFPRWFRENPTDKYTPIRVSRNGSGYIEQAPRSTTPTATTDTLFWQKPVRPTTYASAYYDIRNSPADPGNNNRPRQNAQDTRVNSIVISGSVPSQARQSYGGLHNFPRFLETWTRLWFAGSFLQLNFSNYATAPFDADAWEPTQSPATDEIIGYYGPPNRLWGYDVALQLAPAGPAASRFVTPGKPRNEFYNEPAISDAYMKRLCQAARSNPPAGTSLANLRCPT